MKAIFVIPFLFLLAACNTENQTQADQCLRVDLFKQCMALLPKGPDKTVYNDWDEVVAECGSQSYYQSLRPRSMIKNECRAQ